MRERGGGGKERRREVREEGKGDWRWEWGGGDGGGKGGGIEGGEREVGSGRRRGKERKGRGGGRFERGRRRRGWREAEGEEREGEGGHGVQELINSCCKKRWMGSHAIDTASCNTTLLYGTIILYMIVHTWKAINT